MNMYKSTIYGNLMEIYQNHIYVDLFQTWVGFSVIKKDLLYQFSVSIRNSHRHDSLCYCLPVAVW